MKADRQSRMWPYIGLLLCLFALSVTAPRAWQRAALRYRQGEDSQHSPESKQAFQGAENHSTSEETTVNLAESSPVNSLANQEVLSDTPPARVRVSSSEDRLAMRMPHTDEPAAQVAPSGPLLLPEGSEDSTLTADAAISESIAEETAESSDIATPESTAEDLESPTEEPVTSELADSSVNDSVISSLEDSEDGSVEPPSSGLIATDENNSEGNSLPDEDTSAEEQLQEPQNDENSLAWAAPEMLLEQMVPLEQISAASDWVIRTRSLIEQLSTHPLPSSSVRSELLAELQTAQEQIDRMSATEEEWANKACMLRVKYALSRRLEIWQAIHELGTPLPRQMVTDMHPTSTAIEREEASLCEMLDQLEEFESYRLPHLATSISEQRQSLMNSISESEKAIGRSIEQHYRNANVRLAISEDLMNRFLPKPQVFDAPVDDMILGASVSGNSRTLNQLHLRLIPDERKIRLGLEAHGVVHSNTGASSGPVTIYNRGQTNYVGRKLVLISPSGIHVWPAVAEANAASHSEGMDTDYDSIPLVRSVIRNMAQTKQDESYDQAMAEVEARVEETVRQRLDKEANPRINKLSQEYVKILQGPLERLELSPTPISLSTTEDRAIIRFRIAGDNQLGAHTPRPCAPSDSLASVQIHESVLNNTADQLGLNGQTFKLPELHHMIADKLSLTMPVPDDLPEDALVTFADQDAVVIRCDAGKIWVTLSIAELSQGRRSFKNFRATAVYHLVSTGLHTELERDGVVQLAGQRLNLGEQIALRGVISKMFSQNRRPQVIPSERAADPRLNGLRVTQLVVVDGWIGLAIAPDRLVRSKSKSGTSVNR